MGRSLHELFHRGRHARAASAQNVGGSNDDGQADSGDHFHGLRHIVSGTAGGNAQADFDHGLLELFTVLRSLDRLGVCPDQFGCTGHADETLVKQFHGQVEAGLAAKCW